MKFNPEIHHRHSIRLKGYDYTRGGAYFVTIVTYQRAHLFGEVVNGEMRLNELGQIARDEWFKTADLRPYVKLYEDELMVMPNHAHGIVWIENDDVVGMGVGAERRSAPTKTKTPTVTPKSLGAIVRAYKSAVTYAVNALQKQRGAVLWQRNYYEHIIRNEQEHERIYNYILSNPLNWENDDENIKR